MKIKLILLCAIVAICGFSAHAAMTASVNGVYTLTNLPTTAPTNASFATATNSTGTQIIPVISGPDNNHPFPCAVWMSGAGISAGAYTNTYVWANSIDGVTLCNTNTWNTYLVLNGTNPVSGYTLAAASNYQGAQGFGLYYIIIGGTNGFTNGTGKVTYPH